MTAIRQRDQRIAAVRGFNRFYTRQIGVLRKTFLDSPYSLGEARVLYEIASGRSSTATEIGRALDLDAGYLSRVLRNFEKRGLIERKASARDARQSHLTIIGARPQSLCAARTTLAARHRRLARQAGARRTGPADRGHDHDRNAAARGNANRAAARLHPACTATGRFRLGRQAQRRALRAGISMGASRSKACARKSSPTLPTNSMPSASAAGSPR